MESFMDFFEELRVKAQNSNQTAIGYPVNRQHIFDVDFESLGVIENSLATTYLNNIASPYEYGTYISGHIKPLEINLIAKLAQHFNLEQSNHFGYITYGGTEANLAGIWWHRKFLQKKFARPVTLMCSKYSHYGLKKIADLLQLDFQQIEATEYDLDLNDLEAKLKNSENPIIFVINFGNTVYGAVDDLEEVHKLLSTYKKNKFKIHGDGAIYGLMVPYMPQFKTSIFNYIDTISFSGHKFLGSYSICGAILTTRDYLNEVFHEDNIQIGYIQKAIDVTVAGSRQGFYVAELYLLICAALTVESGEQRLEKVWTECLGLAAWFHIKLVDLLNNIGQYSCQNIIHNQLRVVFPAPASQEKTDCLGKKYGLMPIDKTHLGIYIFPRVTQTYLEQFLDDYKKSMQ